MSCALTNNFAKRCRTPAPTQFWLEDEAERFMAGVIQRFHGDTPGLYKTIARRRTHSFERDRSCRVILEAVRRGRPRSGEPPAWLLITWDIDKASVRFDPCQSRSAVLALLAQRTAVSAGQGERRGGLQQEDCSQRRGYAILPEASDMASLTSAGTFIPNPYIIGQFVRDPTAFFGREDLFDFIRDELHQHTQVILLSGQRRIGKSSLLAHIGRRASVPGEDYVFVQYDLQNKARWPLGQILKDLAEAILRRLNLAPPSWDLSGLVTQPAAFPAYLRQHRPSLRLVLLLDEFDVLHESADKDPTEGFFQYLQSVLEREDRLHIIAVVGRRLEDLPRLLGIFHDAAQREIGVLDEDSACHLIETPARGVLEYSQEAVSAILDLTAGHPYFTQLLCHVIFSRMRDQGRNQVGAEDVEAAVPRAMETGEAGLIWFRDGLPLLERVVFTAVAHAQKQWRAARSGEALKLLREYGVETDRAFREAEQHLERWDFLSNTGGASIPRYRIKIELVKRWLERRFPLRGEIWDLQHLSPLATSRYEAAVRLRERGALDEAAMAYTEALKYNPNHMEALCDLAEVTLELGNATGAVSLYKRAYAADPGRNQDGYLQALLGAGRECLRKSQFDSARQHFSDALVIAPEDPEALSGQWESEAGKRRSLAANNPFLAGAPLSPDEFVGRDKEVSRLLNTIRKGGSALIYGPPGSGKTTLLRYLTSQEAWLRHGLADEREKATLIRLDLSGINPLSSASLFEIILDRAEEEAKERPSKLAIARLRSAVQGGLSNGLRSLARSLHGNLVLLLDEADFVTESLARELRAAMDTTSLVMATSKLPPDSPGRSPLVGHVQLIRLPPLGPVEIDKLIARMPHEFAMSGAERVWVHEVSAGLPLRAQAALQVLYARHAEGRAFDDAEAWREFIEILGPSTSSG